MAFNKDSFNLMPSRVFLLTDRVFHLVGHETLEHFGHRHRHPSQSLYCDRLETCATTIKEEFLWQGYDTAGWINLYIGDVFLYLITDCKRHGASWITISGTCFLLCPFLQSQKRHHDDEYKEKANHHIGG